MPSLFRKPIDDVERRILLVVGVSGVLLGTTLGFIAVRRWEAALAFGAVAIPGSLLCAAAEIGWCRWRGTKHLPGDEKDTTRG